MKINYKNVSIGCAATCMFGAFFGWGIFPKILHAMLASQMALKPGSEMREMWTKVPFPVDFLIYVFNVTNPDEVEDGGKAIVQEIGPYYFEEWKEKYNLVDDPEEDTVTFNARNTFIFRPDKSNGLTGEEVIILPHIILQGIVLVVKRERAPMLTLVRKAMKEIFPNHTAFLTAPFMDIFFRGITVDCSSQDFNVKAVCSAFGSGEAKGVIQSDENTFKFSVFGTSNGSNAGKFTVYRGKKNIRDLGRVVRFDDETELDAWDGEECNKFHGTDSTIFPPFLTKEEGLWAFTPDLCRSLGAVYERKSSFAGLPTLRYGLDLGDIKGDESLQCFCIEPPDNCPVKGTMDLMPCVGAPLVVSMPHFYKGDPSLFNNIQGLNPKEANHMVFIDFEIISGTPVSAAKRLQFNLDMESVEGEDSMQNLPKMVFPLFWVEEGAQLNSTYTNILKNQLFLVLKINAIIKWSCIVLGGLGAIISGYIHFKTSQDIKISVSH